MIKILALVMTIGGAIALVMGVLGIFGSVALMLSPWALTILGFVFFCCRDLHVEIPKRY